MIFIPLCCIYFVIMNKTHVDITPEGIFRLFRQFGPINDFYIESTDDNGSSSFIEIDDKIKSINFLYPQTTIQIYDINDSINEFHLYNIFYKFGNIKYIYIPRHRDNSLRGVAFVIFSSKEYSLNAIESLNYKFKFNNSVMKLILI